MSAVRRDYPGAGIFGALWYLKLGEFGGAIHFWIECLLNTPCRHLRDNLRGGKAALRGRPVHFHKAIPKGSLLIVLFGLLIIAVTQLRSRDFRKCRTFQGKT